jgi:hypothetical protein
LCEPLLFELAMMGTLVLYRDKNGISIQGQVAGRLRSSLRLPRLSEVLVATKSTTANWLRLKVAPPRRSC